MKNRILASCIALTILAGAGVLGARAQEKAMAKHEVKEKTGVIEITKADAAKKEKYDTVLLKVGEESIKLLPGKDKKEFKKLEALGGKEVAVKGAYMPPNPPKYPLAAIKVESFVETKAPAATAAPAAPAKPAQAPVKK